MSSTFGPLRIELLSKDNYDTWRMQVEALLIKNDGWEYVSGEKIKPEPVAGAASNAAAIVAWKVADRKAKSDLILSIHPLELKQIRGCETSREVWLKLESIYASRGPARKATLLKQLILQRMQEGGEVKEHMATFFDVVDKLEALDIQINGELLAIMLLYSLPASYEYFRCAIESRDDLPTAEVLKVKIIEESEARKQNSGEVVMAMAAQGRSRTKPRRLKKSKEQQQQPTRGNPGIVCYKCNTPGHKSNVCPKKTSEKTQAQSKQDLFANAVDNSYVCHMSVPVANRVTGGDRSVTGKPWILDSGCTAHLCGDVRAFQCIGESPRSKLNLANQASANVEGRGVVNVSTTTDQGRRVVALNDTLFVPELRSNLVSVAKITDKGHVVTFSRNGACVTDQSGKVRLVADRKGDLFYIRETVECARAEIGSTRSELLKWHERFGHLNSHDLVKVIRERVGVSVDVNDIDRLTRCDVCLRGKMTALPFPKGHKLCTERLKIVHSDVVGPFRTQSQNGARYFVTYIDDSTRWCEVYFLRDKSGVFETFKKFQNLVERQSGERIKCLQSDNGREYCNSEFDKYLATLGIERRLTIPHTPQQNGVAERKNRTLLDMTRCLILQSGLPASFWTEAVATACYVRNRCPTSSLDGQIPYEKWTGKRLDCNDLRVFGSKVYVLDKDPTRDKMAARSVEGIFVGYPRESKGFRVWLPDARKVTIARDVRFMEEIDRTPGNTDVLDELDVLANSEDLNQTRDVHSPSYLNMVPNSPRATIQRVTTPHTADARAPEAQVERRAPGRPRILRTGSRGRPRKLYQTSRSSTQEDEEAAEINADGQDEEDDDVFAGVAEVSISEAMASSEREEWKDAILSEMMSLVKNDTWDVVQRSHGQNVVGCRLVLTNKHRPDGQIEKRKARLVAKGYSQRFGVDYHHTYAPVARLESMRLLMALAVQLGLQIWQFDVVAAYLNGDLNEEVIMEVPEMLEESLRAMTEKFGKGSKMEARTKKMIKDLEGGGNACRLKKALYGFRQAGRQWHSRFSGKLEEMGLKPTINEPCLYWAEREENVMFVLIYVDDILVASQDTDWIMEIKEGLLRDFDIKDLGPAKHCLGLEINQKEDEIQLSQTGYIRGLLKTYGMGECNPVVMPSELNVSSNEAGEPPADQKKWPYRELIGALMYVSVATRPDIANVVSRLAQFVNEPQRSHWRAAKRVLRYLAGSAELGLIYSQTDKPVMGFANADWGGCTKDRRSYTGYVYILSGAAITWKSQKQRTVALSSTEAEYVSLSEAAKEAVYLRSLLHELNLSELAAIKLYVDNQGARCLASDPVFHARTKHIDIKHHFVREKVAAGIIELEHVPTTQMTADVLTKALPRLAHLRCLEELGMWTTDSEEHPRAS